VLRVGTVAIAAAFILASLSAFTEPSYAGTGSAAAPGFRAAGVVCAVLPEFGGDLLCASSAIKPFAYDGRGIIRLSHSGHLSIIKSGNDVLLALDGDLPRSPRPTLHNNRSWSSGEYQCRVTRGTVRCLSNHRGFSLSRTSFKRT
jgi:hypothetical protein